MKTYLTRPLMSPWRWLAVLAMLGAAAAHLPVIRSHLHEAPYMGVLFIVLSSACVLLAAILISHDSLAVYALAILTCSAAIIGYALTRLVAMPMLSDDVGNWLEPLGLAAVACELLVIMTSLHTLRRRRGYHQTQSGPALIASR